MFFGLELHDCYFFAVLWFSFSKPNHEVREWCFGLNNNFNIYLHLALSSLPLNCDDVHRLKTFVLRILSFSPLSVKVYFLLLSYRSVKLLSGLVIESRCIFISFSFPKMLRKCVLCYSLKLVQQLNIYLFLALSILPRTAITVVFSCRLCFLRAFPFISLIKLPNESHWPYQGGNSKFPGEII